ncbi:hypothetical protein [Lentilactobacillus hilgardii]|uniref:hypothetical protein n=1 Tax=Lentilactobacillus hilgardii TaxID=1588 RepID=UPI0021C33621|nr:hypothetical protein [Lentilactobacillus hilgardii]MCP9333209.1 hypothetical protein [Lentilactobacillus hilgardii]MCP9349858.1 hypothetical protein [Lentilactobacillus hilgardii]MCP9352746.1 hypothetical protein [Lentilactobacillus hilgardii]
MVTGQNYGSYVGANAKVAPVIKSLSLRAVIFDRKVSWYYPQQTMLIVVMTATVCNAYQEQLVVSRHVIDII